MIADIEWDLSQDTPKFTVNGSDILPALAGITMSMTPGDQIPRVTVTISGMPSSPMLGQADVVIPLDTQQTLIGLGWAPPS